MQIFTVLGMAATAIGVMSLAWVLLGQTFGRLAQTRRADGRRVSDDPSLEQLWRHRNRAAVVGGVALAVALVCLVVANVLES